MTALCRALAGRGLRVAQIVLPDPSVPAEVERVRIVQREPSFVGTRGGPVREVAAIWRALHRTGARTYVLQGAGADAGVIAAYCRAAGRRFVFLAASTLDFTGEFLGRGSRDWRLYLAGLRLASHVVVQTDEQRALAQDMIASGRLSVIRNIGPPGEPAHDAGEYFLWAARSVDYKNPWGYVDLARAMPDARFRMIATPSADSVRGVPPGDLRAACAELPNVDWVEPVTHPELIELMRRAVAVVNTSPAEGLPMQFLEAWAAGVPVLSLNVDPDRLIESHGLGRVGGGSLDRALGAAEELWAARQDRAPATRTIRERARGLFDERIVTDAWLDVLGR